MKNKVYIFSAALTLSAILGLLLLPAVSNAATFTAIASGSWSSSATWAGGVAPSSNISTADQVYIGAGFDVSANSDIMIDGALAILDVNGTLDAGANAVTVVNGTVSGTGNIIVDEISVATGALLTFAGSIDTQTFINNGATFALAASTTVENELQLNGGVLSIGSAGLDLESGTVIVMNGGSLSLSGGLLAAVDSYTVVYQGNSNSTIGIEASGSGLSGIEVNLNDVNTQLMLSGDFELNGDLTLSQGTIVIGNNSLTVNGMVDATANGSIDVSSQSGLNVSTSGTGTIDLNFASSSAIIGTLSIDAGSNASAELNGDLTVEAELDLHSGSLNVNGNTLVINGDISASGSGSLTVDNSSDIEIHTNGNVSGSLNFTSGSATMNTLVIDINNGGSVMLGSDAEVSGTLDLQNGFIALGGSDLMVSGNVNGGSDGSYVITTGQGSLMLDLTAATEAFFAVGTDVNYAPATLEQAGGSASGMFGVSVANDVYAAGNAGSEMSAWGPMVDHTWNVTSELSSNIDLTLTLEWDASAQVNAFDNADAYISHYVNAAWDVSATASATLNADGRYELSRSGVSSLSPFAVFDSTTAVGVDEAEELTVSFYPNPTIDVLTYNLNGANGNTNIDLFDMNGKVVASDIAQGTRGTMDVSNLPAGIYTVRIVNENSVTTARMIKQ